jgi:hypothetical protein
MNSFSCLEFFSPGPFMGPERKEKESSHSPSRAWQRSGPPFDTLTRPPIYSTHCGGSSQVSSHFLCLLLNTEGILAGSLNSDKLNCEQRKASFNHSFIQQTIYHYVGAKHLLTPLSILTRQTRPKVIKEKTDECVQHVYP